MRTSIPDQPWEGLFSYYRTLKTFQIRIPLAARRVVTAKKVIMLLDENRVVEHVDAFWPVETPGEAVILDGPEGWGMEDCLCIFALCGLSEGEVPHFADQVRSCWFSNTFFKMVCNIKKSKPDMIKLLQALLKKFRAQEALPSGIPDDIMEIIKPIIHSARGLLALLETRPLPLGASQADVSYLIPFKIRGKQQAGLQSDCPEHGQAIVQELKVNPEWQEMYQDYGVSRGAEQSRGQEFNEIFEALNKSNSQLSDPAISAENVVLKWNDLKPLLQRIGDNLSTWRSAFRQGATVEMESLSFSTLSIIGGRALSTDPRDSNLLKDLKEMADHVHATAISRDLADALLGLVQVSSIAKLEVLFSASKDWTAADLVALKEALLKVRNLSLPAESSKPWRLAICHAIGVCHTEAHRHGIHEEAMQPSLVCLELLCQWPAGWPRFVSDHVLQRDFQEFSKLIGAIVKCRAAGSLVLSQRRKPDADPEELRAALMRMHKQVETVQQFDGGMIKFEDGGLFQNFQPVLEKGLQVLLTGDGISHKGMIYLMNGMSGEHLQLLCSSLADKVKVLAPVVGCHKDGGGKVWYADCPEEPEPEQVKAIYETHAKEVDTLEIENMTEEVQEAGSRI